MNQLAITQSKLREAKRILEKLSKTSAPQFNASKSLLREMIPELEAEEKRLIASGATTDYVPGPIDNI